MKKLLIILCFALCLSGCARGGTSAEEISTGTEMTAAAVAEMQPAFLSQEMAMLEGYVVMQDGDVRHNAGSWVDFLEKAGAGESCRVTVVQYADSDYTQYDVVFDGTDYAASFEKDGQSLTETAQVLVIENGLWDETRKPYDAYEAYLLNDIVLYRDMIVQPDFEGVKEIFLHAKEGEPPVKSCLTEAEVGAVLQLLMTAEYVTVEPEDHVYGMKLLMTNRDGKELVIELDLNKGNYRYGMQTYTYGEVSDMLAALDMEQWPDSVLEEFAAFLK